MHQSARRKVLDTHCTTLCNSNLKKQNKTKPHTPQLQAEPIATSQAVQRGFRKPFQNPTSVHLNESRTQPRLFISTIWVYCGKNPDLCKRTIISHLFMVIVKTPPAFIFFLTFIHSLQLLSRRGRKEPGAGRKPALPVAVATRDCSPGHPADVHTSMNEAPGVAGAISTRRPRPLRGKAHKQLMGQSGHPHVHSLQTSHAWTGVGEKWPQLFFLISYFFLCSLKFWLPATATL